MPEHHVSARAKRVWKRLAEFYGARVIEQFGALPPDPWCKVIEAYDDDAISRALINIQTSHLQYPPTLPEFSAALSAAIPKAVSDKPDVRIDLTNFVMRNYPDIGCGPWKWIVRWFDAPGADGKMRSNHGVEYLGVIIPRGEGEPSLRVMVEDMQLENAA